LFAVINYQYVSSQNSDLIYESVEAVPFNDVALLLGTSKYSDYEDKEESPYFKNRIDAAVELYKHKKVNKILASGDKDLDGIDQIDEMEQALLEKGIPQEAILSDPNGYRTIASIVRAKEGFGLNTFTIVSQEFHNKRALYICDNKGIPAVAYNADDVSGFVNVVIIAREHVARMRMMADLYLFEPKAY
jgi:SanA protein